jgi:NAD(P)-dependent dehydrogenase (short-subunit alcohol dehydrogenase family)
MNRLAGKTAFLAGSTSGIGRVTAELFAAEGAQVIVAGRRITEGQAVVRGILATGGQATYLQADVTQEESIASAIDEAVKRYGKLDILFNNAGGSSEKDGSVVDAALEEFWRVIKLDLFGAFLCSRFAIPHLIRAGGGAIVNMSSRSGVAGSPGRTAYSVAKGAVATLTLTLAKEYASKAIRVNCVAPAAVASERILKRLEDPKTQEQMKATQVLGLIDPAEIAAATLFLASDEARHITGQTLTIHAGNFS